MMKVKSFSPPRKFFQIPIPEVVCAALEGARALVSGLWLNN